MLMARKGLKGLTRDQQTRLETQRMAQNFQLRKLLAQGLALAMVVASVAIPLYFVRDMVADLAGKTTRVNVNLVFSVAITFSAALNGFQHLKIRKQKEELKRVRDRTDVLEAALGGNKLKDNSGKES